MYGPHQYPEKLIPKFINQLMRGRNVTLHGTGTNTRNFLFVEDVARAFEILLFKVRFASFLSFVFYVINVKRASWLRCAGWAFPVTHLLCDAMIGVCSLIILLTGA